MKIEDYLVTSTVNGVMAQRLVRRLCEACRRKRPLLAEAIERIGLAPLLNGKEPVLYEAVGCEKCHGSGYRGQMAVIEVLPVTDAIRRLVLNHAEAREIHRIAIEEACGRCIRTASSRRSTERRPSRSPARDARCLSRCRMPEFRYVAVDPASQTTEGRMDAASKSAVVERLHASGQVPIRIDELGCCRSTTWTSASCSSGAGSRGTPSPDHQPARDPPARRRRARRGSRHPLELLEKPRERQSLRTLARANQRRHDARRRHGRPAKVFPGFYVSMVRAGEAGASLEAVLGRLAESWNARGRARARQVRAALPDNCGGHLLRLDRHLADVRGAAVSTAVRAGRPCPPDRRPRLLFVSDFVQGYWWLGVLIPS